MNLPRWIVSTCLGTAIVCCGLHPQWFSGDLMSARDSGIHAADPTKVASRSEQSATADNQTALFQVFAQRPLSFERYVGQSAPKIQFVSRGSGFSMALSSNEAVLSLAAPDQRKGRARQDAPIGRNTALRMSLVGANQNVTITGIDPLEDKVNYLMGNDPEQWKLHVPHFARVKYEGVYPGIDLLYHGNQRQLEYDFVVGPGADPGQIRLSFEGTKSLRLDPTTGDLVITLVNGAELRHQRPVIYQMADSKRADIAGGYRIFDQQQAAFTIASYDARKPLIIDPTLDFTMSFGGSSENFPAGIAVDNEGNAYVTGYTLSTDFPQVGASLGSPVCTTSDNAMKAGMNRPKAVPSRARRNSAVAATFCDTPFVTKISPQGKVLFSTYFGGTGSTSANAIAVDATGIFITGSASTNFITNAKYAFGGSLGNAYVADLDPSGDFFHWVVGLGGGAAAASTCNPSTGPCTELLYNIGMAIALDAQHNAYIAGYTTAIDFPTTEYFEGQHTSWQPVYGASASSDCATQSPLGFCQNGFVAKVPSTGSFDDGGYATYIGGNLYDAADAIAVDGTGHAYVTGFATSPNFPAAESNAGAPPLFGGNTSFVTKLLPDGSGVVYSNFLGGKYSADGAPSDSGNGIAVDRVGQAHVAGVTCSPNFPTTPGAAQTSASVYCSTLSFTTIFNESGFVSVLSPAGALMYSTLFGGPGPTGQTTTTTEGDTIALNARDEVYVGGYTSALDILGNTNPLQSTAENTGIVLKFSPDLSHADFVNYIGTGVTGVAVEPPCPGIRCIIESLFFGYQIYATGYTYPSGVDVTNENNLHVFVAKWTDDNLVVTPGPPTLRQF